MEQTPLHFDAGSGDTPLLWISKAHSALGIHYISPEAASHTKAATPATPAWPTTPVCQSNRPLKSLTDLYGGITHWWIDCANGHSPKWAILIRYGQSARNSSTHSLASSKVRGGVAYVELFKLFSKFSPVSLCESCDGELWPVISGEVVRDFPSPAIK